MITAEDFDPNFDRVAVVTRNGKEIKHRNGKFAQYAVLKGERVIAWCRPLKSASAFDQALEIAKAQDVDCDVFATILVNR